jgi:hypothetical protein
MTAGLSSEQKKKIIVGFNCSNNTMQMSYLFDEIEQLLTAPAFTKNEINDLENCLTLLESESNYQVPDGVRNTLAKLRALAETNTTEEKGE